MMKTEQIFLGIFLIVSFCFLSLSADAKNPPGTVKVRYNDTIMYITKDPVMVSDWAAFLWFTKKEKSLTDEEIAKFIPDSNLTYKDFVLISTSDNRNSYLANIPDDLKESYVIWLTKSINNHPKRKKIKLNKLEYKVLSYDDYMKICGQTKKLKPLENEHEMFRCYVVVK